ncbi:TOC75, chloroplastic-like protein [Drosera capensis]
MAATSVAETDAEAEEGEQEGFGDGIYSGCVGGGEREESNSKTEDVVFYNEREKEKLGLSDSSPEMLMLTLGEVCLRTQLEEELESPRTCRAFEKFDMEVKTNVDGAIGLECRCRETLCRDPLKFRCINVGLLEAIETDEDATDEELRRQYNERVRKARGCLLRSDVEKEIVDEDDGDADDRAGGTPAALVVGLARRLFLHPPPTVTELGIGGCTTGTVWGNLYVSLPSSVHRHRISRPLYDLIITSAPSKHGLCTETKNIEREGVEGAERVRYKRL